MLIIMRGLPGSGKSYLVGKISQYFSKTYDIVKVFSTDNYFMKGGQYVFDVNRLFEYHKKNQYAVRDHLFRHPQPVLLAIVDNTNTTFDEMKPYCDYAHAYNHQVVVWETRTEWSDSSDECFKRNTHSVPLKAIEKMSRRFQNHQTIIDKFTKLYNKQPTYMFGDCYEGHINV